MSFPILLVAIATAGLCVAPDDVACESDEFTTAFASYQPPGASVFRGVDKSQEGQSMNLLPCSVLEVF